MNPIPNPLLKALEERKAAHTLRQLSMERYAIDFYSNDYIGLAKNTTVRTKAQAILEQYSPQNGSTGSRLLSGNYPLIREAETYLASFHAGERGLIFNSGYDANVGIFSAIPQRGDVVLYDQYIHASIRDGLQLNRAQHFKFKHNSLEDLQAKLKRFSPSATTLYIATEAVFSMDGDTPDLPAMVALAQQYGAYIIIDEAHSVGVFGEKGAGLCQALGIAQDIFLRLITFGKGIGAHGAIVLAQAEVIDYLVNFARSFIYTTAAAPESIATLMASYVLLPELKERGYLHENIAFFREKAKVLSQEKGLHFIDSTSAIQGLIIPDSQRVKEMAARLQQRGMGVKPILSPTVPKGEERLRICLHSYNTKEEIELLFQVISEA
ncbi:putative 8-amino-7-oxononanoate synthase [Capnocytophaga sp. oral taxon 863 str. F0517]|uniref:aminotransferase class I/II-fold pyridoxal phosphate-dependent enzyme n=1 Tax=Capnocytophaga sp. oral taxon 863 TaxID=1227265 RepID=UPI0003972BAA|nr:8-amino-7-oxononanoate synthase [Capnocytophaga sp. oral taxon 863]ERI64626.1 putative 8-amino-7-oxononanoate synthase [Capnocytophaga sp. oral taxon 863 str. F0517]